jgi:hypothetical protein
LLTAGFNIVHWTAMYDPPTTLAAIDCEVKWSASASRMAATPSCIESFQTLQGVQRMIWKE